MSIAFWIIILIIGFLTNYFMISFFRKRKTDIINDIAKNFNNSSIVDKNLIVKESGLRIIITTRATLTSPTSLEYVYVFYPINKNYNLDSIRSKVDHYHTILTEGDDIFLRQQFSMQYETKEEFADRIYNNLNIKIDEIVKNDIKISSVF